MVALERDPEQAAKMLPWLRVLRDMRPEDAEAGQAIADEVLSALTVEQRAALQRVREQARERGGPPGGQGAGPPDPTRRAEFRRRAIERAIRLLEGKIPPRLLDGPLSRS